MGALLAAAIAMASPALADKDQPPPRFVSLRSDKINLRTGPGTDYPVEWVYTRRRMPVEVTAEFENWRKIRDWRGTEGWVHQSMIDGRRTALIIGEIRVMRRAAAAESGPVARVEPGVIGLILECVPDWCRIEVDGLLGWLRRDEFYGVYPVERIE
jgi:SH3-like domain-containing protein